MKHRTITVSVDKACSMARVSFEPIPENGTLVTSQCGNFWDFHPFCYGTHCYGYYKGYNSLANAMKRKLKSYGYHVTITNEEYRFDANGNQNS